MTRRTERQSCPEATGLLRRAGGQAICPLPFLAQGEGNSWLPIAMVGGENGAR